MTTDFLTAIAVMLVAGFCCGTVTRKIGMTQTAGELLAGILLGPALLGQVWPGVWRRLLPSAVMPSVALFGLVMVLVYIAETAADTDGRVIDLRGPEPIVIAACSTAIALVSALVIERSYPGLIPRHVSHAAFTLFVAAALLVTAVPVLARVLDETGLARTYIGGWALAIAVYADVVAFTLVSVATPLAKHSLSAFVLAGPVMLLVIGVGCRLLAPAITRVDERWAKGAVELIALIIALAVASAVGASPLVVAFMVGILLWRRTGRERTGMHQSVPLVRVLIPLYIVYSGFQVDLGALGGRHLLGVAGLVLVLAVVGKFLAGVAAARVLHLAPRETRIIVVLGNTRGLTELILINLGYRAGILSIGVYSVLFVMTLVTTAGSSMLTRLVARGVSDPERSPSPATITSAGMKAAISGRG